MESDTSRDRDALAGIVPSLHELIALHGHRSGIRQPPSAILTPPTGRQVPARSRRGMAFAEVRPYFPGDDVRSVDWRQSARRGRLYTKVFDEEREQAVMLLVDLGPDMRFGTRRAFKSVVAARAAAWLAWQGCTGGDRIGGIVWNGGQMRALPPLGRERGALAIIRLLVDLASAPPTGNEPLAVPLRRLLAPLPSDSMTVVISDFAGLDDDCEAPIRRLAQISRLTLLHVCDPFEMKPPPPARYPVTDGRRHALLDLLSESGRAAHTAAFDARCERLERLARSTTSSCLRLATDDDLPRRLASAFLKAWAGQGIAA